MKKLIAIGLVISIALSIIIVGVSLAKDGAGAAKMPLWDSRDFTYDGGAVTTDDAYGFVILNTNASGELIVNFVLKGAAADAVFKLFINQVNGSGIVDQTTSELTNNSQGNGNAHFNLTRLVNANKFWVSAIDFVSGQKLRSVAVVLD